MALHEQYPGNKTGEQKMNFLRWLNKKGISTDILVIILLIVGLVIAVILFITFISSGKSSSTQLFNLTAPLKEGSGLK